MSLTPWVPRAGDGEGSTSWVLLLLFVVAGLLFAIRLATPSDLEGYAQARSIGYVMDVVARQNWWLPFDLDGEITSKPPLHTWLAGGLSWLLGDVNRFTLTLPSFLSVVGTAWVVFLAGQRYMGLWPACYSAVVFLVSPLTIKHMALVRADAVFMFMVAVAAWLAFRAWHEGRSWTPFWVAVTLAMFAKGPLGLALAAGGLLVAIWERGTPRAVAVRRNHLPGAAFLVVSVGLWGVLAWRAQGEAVVQKMIFDELLGHAAGVGRSTLPGSAVWKPYLYLLSRFLPWSLLTAWAVWTLWRHPPTGDGERSWMRFVICWLGVGLAIFAMAANHRADHLLPLLPAAALLAGWQFDVLVRRWGRVPGYAAAMTAAAILLVSVGSYYRGLSTRQGDVTSRTREIQELAFTLRERFEDEVSSLVPVDTPTSLGLYLKDYQRKVPVREAAARLREDSSQLIMIRDLDALQSHLDDDSIFIRTVFEWRGEDSSRSRLYIIRGEVNDADES